MLRLRKYETSGPKILLDVQSQKSRGLTKKIRELDGYCFDSKCFEKSATHLITDVIRCNEKFLGACVRGLWVLSPKYVEDSCKVGMWLEEEEYEHSLQHEHRSFELVAAAKRWRWRISKHNEQPFTGMHVALLLGSHSVYYERLLIYGGAQVLKLSLPLRGDINVSQILYLFTDSSYKDHVQMLQEYGLVCLDYTFIVDTIIKDKELDILEYIVREDSNASHLLSRSLSCFTGQKSASIGCVDHHSQTSIETIEVKHGVYNVVDLSVDEPAVENPQVRRLKPKSSRVTPLTIGSSPCISQNATGPVNTAAKGGLARLGNGHAHLKNVTNLCTKENALVESKDIVFPGSQRPCDVGLDILKANVQKSTLKESNDPVLVHIASIIESKTSSTDKCRVDLSLGTVKLKTQNSSSEAMEKCINNNEETYTKTEVLSALSKQQTSIQNLESQESKRKSSDVNNSLIHIGELKYKLNPSIHLNSGCGGALSSATSKKHTTPGKLCKHNKNEKIIKRNADSYGRSGFKIKPVKISSQRPVINGCVSQKKLHHGDRHSLPLVQVNIQLHDCHIPHVMIDGEGSSSQTDNTAEEDDMEWENADVNLQYYSSSIVSQPDVHTAAHVDTNSMINTGLSSKSGSTSGRQNNEDKSGCTSGRQNNEDKSGGTSGRKGNEDKSGGTSDRKGNEDKSGGTSDRKDNEDKSGGTSGRQDNEDKSGGTSGRQDNEDKHRSLWTDIIYIDDDDDTSDVKKTESSSMNPSLIKPVFSMDRLQLSNYAPEANRQDIEDKHRSLWADVVYVDDDLSEVKKSESSSLDPSLSPIEPTDSMDSLQLSKLSTESRRRDNGGKSGRQDIEDKHRSLWTDIIYIDDDLSEVKNSESSSVDRSSSPLEPTVSMDRLQLSEYSPEASSTSGRQDNEDKSRSTSGRQDNEVKSSRQDIEDKSESTSGRQANEDKHRSVWTDIIYIDDDLSEVKKGESSSGHRSSSPITATVTMERLKLSKSSLEASPECPSTSEMQNFSPLAEKSPLSQSDTKFSPAGLSIMSTNVQARLQSFGFSSVSRKGKDTKSKVHLPRSKATLAVSSLKAIGKRRAVNAVSKTTLKTHTPRGLAKRRVLGTTLSQIETTVRECPEWPPDNREEESSFSVEGTQSNACANASACSTVNGYITMCNPSAPSQSSSTDLSHLSTQTQRGLAKRRAMDDSVVLSESKVPKNPSDSGGDVTSPVIEDAKVDVCDHNKSVHDSSTKNDYSQAKYSLFKSLSWDFQLFDETRNTQRGLAKKKASFPQTQGTNQNSSLWCPADGRGQDQICATAKDLQPVTRDDSDSDGDSSPNNPYSKMIHPSSHSCSMTDAGVAADCLNAVKSEKETVPKWKFDNVQNSGQVNGSTDRSLFESFSKHLSGIKSEMGCSDDDVHIKGVKSEPGSGSELTASADVHMISRVSQKSKDIKEFNLFKKESVGVNIASTADIIDDYIDLPTPPSIICHDSDAEASTAVSTTNEAVLGELSLADNPGIEKECVLDEEVQPQEGIQRKVCDNKHMEPETSRQSSESHPVWPLTYLVSSSIHPPDNKPFLPVIYGQWMESAREMGFYDQAIAHARPTKSRLPTSLLLSELVQLARSTHEDVCPQAITYLYSWLELHPPLTPVTVKLYTEAFELSSESSVVFDILNDIMDESKQSLAILLLEYFVSVFEINFDFSLRSGKKTCLQNSLIVKWLWRNSYTIVHGSATRRLLQLLEHLFTAPLLNCRACNAACALLSLACECLRLANVQWDQRNPQFVINSVITLSRDIAKRIHSSFKTGDKARSIVLNMLRPAWLRMLIAAILLSYYNDYLLSDAIHVNEISMNSIVSQFFYLVPLEPSENSDAQDRVERNHSIGHTLNPSQTTFDTKKNKGQKGILTAEKVNKRNGKGESAIHIACMKNKAADLAKLLAVPRADVNLRDNSGWTPLHEACYHGSVPCVQLLLKHAPAGASTNQEQSSGKVDIDAQGPEGLTPFHEAVWRNHIDVCKLLLSYGGKKLLKSKTHDNRTAINFVQTDEMRTVLNSSSEASSLCDLSISQDVDDPAMIVDAVTDIAPLTQRYKEVTGTDCGHLTSRSSCEEFLMLLTVLVSSYYSILGSPEKNNQIDLKEKEVLGDMNMHLKMFKRHLRKLTRPEDFDKLQFRLECFESLCIYKPENIYL